MAGGTPSNGDVISAKGIYLDMQLGEATYSDICVEGPHPCDLYRVSNINRNGYFEFLRNCSSCFGVAI